MKKCKLPPGDAIIQLNKELGIAWFLQTLFNLTIVDYLETLQPYEPLKYTLLIYHNFDIFDMIDYS